MKNWSRLVLPIVLGIVAGVMHYQILARETMRHRYVKLTRDLRPGDPITPDCLASFELPGDMRPRQKTVIPWDERDVVLHSYAIRELYVDNPLYYSDSSNEWLVLSDKQRKEMSPITFELPKTLFNSTINLHVRAVLEFQVSSHKSDEWTKQLEPLQIMNVRAVADDREKIVYNVTLAVPNNNSTGGAPEWVYSLKNDLKREEGRRVLGITIREPDANPSPRARQQAVNTTSDEGES